MIIGLTGKNASGKGEVAKFLQERGFQFASLSDALRAELKKRRITPTRDHLTRLGNELREKHGPGVLAERILKTLGASQNYVVDSFRNPSEVEVFRSRPDFILWAVTASPAIRFQRIKTRAREKDPTTLKQFVAVEQREAHNVDRSKQSLDACEKLADEKIGNNGTLDALHQRLVVILKKNLKAIKRPSWDRYFMDIAQQVASRSNCIKRKVAAVIVKNGRIISTRTTGSRSRSPHYLLLSLPACYALK